MLAVLQNNPRRTAAYAAAFVILAAVYAARFNTFATAGEALYAFGGILATAAALIGGELALQRFRTEQRDALLLISAGLWVAAALHLYHFAAYTGVFGPADSLIGAASVLRGQLIPTLFVSLFLVLSLLASRQSRPSTAQPAGIFFAAATLAFIVAVGSLVFPVPQSSDLVEILGQPISPLAAQPELLLVTALTVSGIAGLVRRARWRADPFDRWLLLALIVTLVALARFPLLQVWPSGAVLLLSQVLTLASYLCVIAGVVPRVAARPAATVAAERTPRPLAADAAEPTSAAAEKSTRSPELALRDLQASHRALRNATEGLLVGLHSDGTITDWKPAADFGPSAMPSEFLGKNVRAVLPTDQAESIMAAVARVLQAGKTERLQHVAADGSVVLGGSVTPHTADQVLCIIQDHTAHARATQELDEQRRAANALRLVTGDWLIYMSRAGTIQDLQPPAAAAPATYADMFAGKHLGDVFQGDDVTPLVQAAAASLASNAVQELSFLRQSGQVLAVRVAPHTDDAVLCLLRDITELKDTTAQLQVSEEENQALRAHLERLNAEQASALTHAETSVRILQTLLPDLVLRLRTDGIILECKPAESFGPRDGERLVDARVREVLPVDLASQLMAAVERAQSDGQPHRFTCHPVGGQVLAGGVAALTDEQFICVVRDQTQQKQMETALAQQAAILAKEMQAKLEEESLRALRSENDVLRAQLLRVAQIALEGGGTTEEVPSATGSTPEDAPIESEDETSKTAQPTESQSPRIAPPAAQPQNAPATPTPPATTAAGGSAQSAPGKSPEANTPANGDPPPRHSAEAGADGAPQGSADRPMTATESQGKTAVATRQATNLAPTVTENGQEENTPLTNGEPTEEIRPS